MTFVGAPLIGISSSFIREGIRNGRNMQVFLPVKVWNYIEEMGFYR
jgi:nicotinate-nucleotide adenylyltransferase